MSDPMPPQRSDAEIGAERRTEAAAKSAADKAAVEAAIKAAEALRRHQKMASFHYKRTLPHLHWYRRQLAPGRPSTLPEEDDVLLEQLREARFNGQKRREDRDLMMMFGRWRGAVTHAEARAEGNILFLLRVAHHFLKAREGAAEDTARKLEEAAETVRVFVCVEYRFHIDAIPETEQERERLARRHSHMRDVMSDALLMEGTRRPQTEDTADPGPTQVEIEEVLL